MRDHEFERVRRHATYVALGFLAGGAWLGIWIAGIYPERAVTFGVVLTVSCISAAFTRSLRGLP